MKRLVYCGMLIGMMLLSAGCSEYKQVVNRADKGIVYCAESDPSWFNPQIDTSSTTADASAYQIYNRLLEFDPIDGKITPSLASSWRVSRDGLSYIFQLRKPVSFHSTEYFTPTRLFNADDVIFSFERWLDTQHPYHLINGGRYPYFDSLKLRDNINRIERVNGYRVKITLNEPDSTFLANLATDFAVILSAEYASQLMAQGTPELIDTIPIGTGPYKFNEYRRNQYIRFNPHPDYWRGPVKPSQLIFDITANGSLRFAKLLTGECDTIAYPSQSEIDYLQGNPSVAVQSKPGLNTGFWAFNTQKPPFDNRDVRRALAMAVDKSTLVDAIYFNSATLARSLIPPTSWAFNANMRELDYNPIRAKALLTEAGYPNGFSMTIYAMPLERDYNPDSMRMAELIANYLAELDINVDIVTDNWDAFKARLARGEHDSVLIGWSADNADPDNFYRPLLSCAAIASQTNRAKYCNPQYDELVSQATKITNIERRQALYQQVNQLIADDMPLMPIAHANQSMIKRKTLQGVAINPYGAIRFDYARHEADNTP